MTARMTVMLFSEEFIRLFTLHIIQSLHIFCFMEAFAFFFVTLPVNPHIFCSCWEVGQPCQTRKAGYSPTANISS